MSQSGPNDVHLLGPTADAGPHNSRVEVYVRNEVVTDPAVPKRERRETPHEAAKASGKGAIRAAEPACAQQATNA